MKHILYIFLLFFLGILQSCVSNQKYVDTEARRLFAESEANKLRFDTMSKAKDLRFLRKSASDYVDKIGSLLIDTTTMARQTRECWKENYKLLAAQGGNVKVMQEALAKKEIELAEKERKLANAETFTGTNSLSSEQMYQNFSLVKSKIGSFATNGVEISLKNEVIWIAIPESMMFDNYGMNVQGKGLPIIIKLAEILKQQPNLVTTIYVYSQNIDLDSPLFNENWNTCALRSSSVAQIFIRYGATPFQITSASMIHRDEKKGKVEIAIIGK